MTTKQQPDPAHDHQTTTVHDHGALSKYNRTHMLDLRDSIFGSSGQMTITPQKMRMENIKNRKENGWQTRSFQQVFFFVQIGAESTAGAKHQKMRMVPRVPNGKKTESYLILPFCGAGPTQILAQAVLNFFTDQQNPQRIPNTSPTVQVLRRLG